MYTNFFDPAILKLSKWTIFILKLLNRFNIYTFLKNADALDDTSQVVSEFNISAL